MYTQNNEEILIHEYFKGASSSNMFLLDVGANDGKTFSNSLALIETGWNGFLLEPSPKAFQKLKALHADNHKVKCLNYGISLTSGEVHFYESAGYEDGEDVALYSSISENEIKRWNGKVKFEQISVTMKTWEQFLAENKPSAIDFITIDIEGHDLEVLMQIDLTALKTKMVIAEWNSVNSVGEGIINYCSKHCLHEISRNAENIIFAK